jgi:hypothetical protein
MCLCLILQLQKRQRLAKTNEWSRLVRDYENAITALHRQLRWIGVAWIVLTFALLIKLRTP